MGAPLFTSALTVNETLLLAGAGYHAVGQVMGVSVFQTGVQFTSGGWTNKERKEAASKGISYEVTTMTSAFYEARHLALGRLLEQASRLGAHWVVGVHAERVQMSHEEGAHLFELKASGTAMRGHAAPGGKPVLCNLSGQELRLLQEGGHRPVGLVAGNCYWRHMANRETGALLLRGRFSRSGRSNLELKDVTTAIYQARELALSRLQAEATQAGAEGVVGVKLHSHFMDGHPQDANSAANSNVNFASYGLVSHFLAEGTAIVRQGARASVPVSPYLGLGEF